MQAVIVDNVILHIDNYELSNGLVFSTSISVGEWIYVNPTYAKDVYHAIRRSSSKNTPDANPPKVFIQSREINDISQIRRKFGIVNPVNSYPDNSCVQDLIDAHKFIFRIRDFDDSLLISQLENFNLRPTDKMAELSIQDHATFTILKLCASDINMILIDRSLDLLDTERRYKILSMLHSKTVVDGLSVLIATNDKMVQERYLGRSI